MRGVSGGFLISQVKQIQARVFDVLLQREGIGEFNGAQGRILYVLWQEDGLPIVEVSRRTGLAKTTLTGMLDRMEKQGFLIRVPDEQDRRQLRIVLTEKARALSAKYDRVSEEMDEIFYEGISDEDIRRFEATLERILENLRRCEGK